MAKFEPRDPDYEAKVRSSFGKQTAMQTLGAVIGRVVPGEVEIEMPYRADLAQQHGFIYGGIVAAIGDSACGYAAFSLSAPDPDFSRDNPGVQSQLRNSRQRPTVAGPRGGRAARRHSRCLQRRRGGLR